MGEEITGFDQLDAKLQSILDQSLAKRNKFVAQQAELLNGRVKDNTPVDTGTLRNGWHRSRAAKGAATVYNNTHYAGHVETGEDSIIDPFMGGIFIMKPKSITK